ncbi:MAG: PAS domain S-box protein [Myxococcales bacterium]|nr:PAS domain S-box protein [Myxococcales bacterium]
MPDFKDAVREAFNQIPVAAWAIDKEGTVLLSEGAHLRNIGFAPGQIVGMNLFDMYAGDPESAALIREALAGRELETETALNGRTIKTTYKPIRDAEGEPIGLVGITEDLTEERETEATIAAQTSELREQAELLDLTHDAIVVRGLDGVITYWNRGAERLYGYSAEEARGRVAVELLHSDLPAPLVEIEAALRDREFWEGEVDQRTRAGEAVVTASRWILRRDDAGGAISVLQIDTDITENKRAREAEARRQGEIIRAQAAAIEELSTPLIPITDKILVMPLIGAMDSTRAKLVIDSLLTGIGETGGEFAILDITGIPVVDTAVAGVLIKAARAVRLLGAEAILTGMRPEVAQTLVNIDVDLGGIITRGTLQGGITYALGRRKLEG